MISITERKWRWLRTFSYENLMKDNLEDLYLYEKGIDVLQALTVKVDVYCSASTRVATRVTLVPYFIGIGVFLFYINIIMTVTKIWKVH